MNRPKITKSLFSFFGILIVILIPVIILSCKNVLMDVLEAPEITVIYDGQEIRADGEIRLGNMELGTENSYDFLIKNKGKTGTLTISETDPVVIGGLDAAMISVSNILKTVLAPEESTELTFTFAPFGSVGEKVAEITISSDDEDEGSYTFTIIANVAVSTTDLTGPTVAITSTESGATNISPIPVTVTFSEEIVDFTAANITVSGGNIDNLQTTDNTVFTVDVTNPVEGDITLYIPQNTTFDYSANGNNASNLFSLTYDVTAPTVFVESDNGNFVNTEPFPITIIFSEYVYNFDITDIDIGTGTVINFNDSGNPEFTADIDVVTGPVDVTIDVQAGVAYDAASNNSSALDVVETVTYNTGAPTVIVSSDGGEYTNVNPAPVTITFSEEMTGFDSSDITISNGGINSFNTSDDIEYTFTVLLSGDPATTNIMVGAGKARAAAGEQYYNIISNTCTVTYDGTNPTGSMQIDGGNEYTNITDVDLTFSADGTGTDIFQMQVSNDSDFSTGDGWEAYSATKLNWEIHDPLWDFEIYPATDPGEKIIYYRFKDTAGNDSDDYSAAITLTQFGHIGISKIGGALFN
jgi:hypothetical protein